MSDIVKYYQSIPELGIVGRMDTPKEFEAIGLPKDLTNKSVLDIGCNSGAFMLECLHRGAMYAVGIEPNLDWRIIAQGILCETGFGNKSIMNKHINKAPVIRKYDLVLLLSVTHLDEVENPQELIDKAWELTKQGGLLIIEVNDRLQRKEVKLPDGTKYFGKNKDNRSVYHCVKDNT